MMQSSEFNHNQRGLRDSGRKLSRLITVLLAVLTAACCAGMAFGVWAHNRSISKVGDIPLAMVRPSQSSPIPHVPGSGSTIQRLDIEVITIRPNGFERAQITRPRGLFGIAVENRSGLSEVVLRLDRVTGARLHEVRVPREKLNWKQELDLPPGSYLLTEATNPDWVCSIVITEK